VFEQYAQVLRSDIPHLHVEGETYPPPLLNQYLSNVVFVVRMALLLLLAAGPDALRYIGIENPPPIYVWAQENKVGPQETVSLYYRAVASYVTTVNQLYISAYSWLSPLSSRLCGKRVVGCTVNSEARAAWNLSFYDVNYRYSTVIALSR